MELNCVINIDRELSFPLSAWEEHSKWAKKPGESKQCDVWMVRSPFPSKSGFSLCVLKLKASRACVGWGHPAPCAAQAASEWEFGLCLTQLCHPMAGGGGRAKYWREKESGAERCP